MKLKNKKGFTLVELLAVIAILAILVIFAMPNILNMFKNAKKNSFINEAKVIYKEVPKKFLQDQLAGNNNSFYSSVGSNKLDINGKLDYCVMVDSQGKVKKIAVGNNEYHVIVNNADSIESIVEDALENGPLDFETCGNNVFASEVPAIACTYNGTMTPGAEYINGQYTYRYMQEGDPSSWSNISDDGWGVILTDKTSTSPVTSEICTTINDKPIVSASFMYYTSKASSIDLSSFNTSNVTNMYGMFVYSKATTLDVSKFDTSNVTNMSGMFSYSQATTLDVSKFDTSNVTDMSYMFSYLPATTLDVSKFDTSKVTTMQSMFDGTKATTIDLSSFDTSNVTTMSSMFSDSQATSLDLSSFNTSNVKTISYMFYGTKATTIDVSKFDTSNVTNMSYMFENSQATTLDLSNFDTSNVTDMSYMFYDAKATTGFARTQADANKFNASSDKPAALTFIVKPLS